MSTRRSRWGAFPWALALAALVLTPLVVFAAVSVRAGSTELVLEVDGRTGRFPVTASALSGERVDVTRSERSVHGRVFGRKVELQLSPGRVRGQYGTRPVRLEVKRSGVAIAFEGSHGERDVAVSASPTSIVGSIGGCSYSLVSSSDRYSGFRDCDDDKRPMPVVVDLPEVFAGEPDDAVAAVLFLALAPDGLTSGIGGVSPSARTAPPRRPR